MSIENDPDGVQAATRTSQIIVGALIMGVIWFLVIVLVFLDAPARPPGEGPAASANAGHHVPRGRVRGVRAGRVVPRAEADGRRRAAQLAK